MAKIENTEKQISALKYVNENLELLKAIHMIIQNQGDLSLTRMTADKKKYTADISGRQEIKILAILEKSKKELIKEILRAAKSNHIIFSADEKIMLDPEAVVGADGVFINPDQVNLDDIESDDDTDDEPADGVETEVLNEINEAD